MISVIYCILWWRPWWVDVISTKLKAEINKLIFNFIFTQIVGMKCSCHNSLPKVWPKICFFSGESSWSNWELFSMFLCVCVCVRRVGVTCVCTFYLNTTSFQLFYFVFQSNDRQDDFNRHYSGGAWHFGWTCLLEILQ